VSPFGPCRPVHINAGLLFLMAITSMEVYGVIIAGWAPIPSTLSSGVARIGADW